MYIDKIQESDQEINDMIQINLVSYTTYSYVKLSMSLEIPELGWRQDQLACKTVADKKPIFFVQDQFNVLLTVLPVAAQRCGQSRQNPTKSSRQHILTQT